ncbi:hypothetical protein [Nonomuraea soli]|uniref:Uncharacterized protein n=1 Tax=Nonomuraea soli TaxID=1032476 RepID=A0A7W0CNT2_9ACTN|nr:hypothetical protein [Nonomuraea soli]MBA2894452.1 hypothetical protein [Nonomuraea soli]
MRERSQLVLDHAAAVDRLRAARRDAGLPDDSPPAAARGGGR